MSGRRVNLESYSLERRLGLVVFAPGLADRGKVVGVTVDRVTVLWESGS